MMNAWTSEAPTEPGRYWYRNENGGVLVEVRYWQDLQQGIERHLAAEPLLPYPNSSHPLIDVRKMRGEWRAAEG